MRSGGAGGGGAAGGAGGRPLDLLLARDFAAFEARIGELIERGMILRGRRGPAPGPGAKSAERSPPPAGSEGRARRGTSE